MSSAMTLNFGKYKSRNIDEVFRIDPSYARWLHNQDVLANKSKEIRQYLEEKFRGSEDNSSILRFGKHRGKSLNWVYDNDRAYIDYLKRNEFVNENCPSLRDELKRLF